MPQQQVNFLWRFLLGLDPGRELKSSPPAQALSLHPKLPAHGQALEELWEELSRRSTLRKKKPHGRHA